MKLNHSTFSDLSLSRIYPKDASLVSRYSNLAQKLILQSSLFERDISLALCNSYSFGSVYSFSQSDFLALLSTNNKDIAMIHACSPQFGVGTIMWLLVDKSFQRHKLGLLLLDQCILFYCELGAHKVRVTSPTIANQAFYLKYGFKLEGILEKHWHKVNFYNYGLLLEV